MHISDWSAYVCSSDLPFPTDDSGKTSPGKCLRGTPANVAASGRNIGQVHRNLPCRGRNTAVRPSAAACKRLSFRAWRSEEHTSELQSLMRNLVCRLLLEKKNKHNHKEKNQIPPK